jgi:hypothetical protein
MISSLAAALLLVPPGLESWGLDPFYQQGLMAGPLPILSSSRTSLKALEHARTTIDAMLAMRPDIKARLAERRVRVAIIGAQEQTTDIPEYRDLPTAFPGVDWNARARGLGATPARPAISAGEENILGLPGDRYKGESILVHEFAHAVMDMAVVPADATFLPKLNAAYGKAIKKGLWRRTYAATNTSEYWAEGVQSWFAANRTASPPNGVHNHINGRAALAGYDPDLASLIGSVFGPVRWTWKDPAK